MISNTTNMLEDDSPLQLQPTWVDGFVVAGMVVKRQSVVSPIENRRRSIIDLINSNESNVSTSTSSAVRVSDPLLKRVEESRVSPALPGSLPSNP